jgi:hypothetical protein
MTLASRARRRHTVGMPRFVLLRHECPPELGAPSHWDLMLENGPALATWRLFDLPAPAPSSVSATKLADHRLEYLEYEGPLSGGRGDVRRIDAGQFEDIDISGTRWQVRFVGTVLEGPAVLEFRGGEAWTLRLPSESSAP